jgi:hypothetical protein
MRRRRRRLTTLEGQTTRSTFSGLGFKVTLQGLNYDAHDGDD